MVLLSVIIVNYNSLGYLRRCLESIRKDASCLEREAIVVDNASEDGSVEFLKQQDDVKSVFNEENVGFAKANNQGLKLAAGKYVLFINPDTSFAPGTLGKLVSILSQAEADDVRALGCRVVGQAGSLHYTCGMFPTFLSIALHRLPGKFLSHLAHLVGYDRYYEEKHFPDWVSGCCLLMSKQVLDELKGFDEDYFMYVEEVDLLYRLRKLGFKVLYDPSVTVTHYYQGGEEERREQKARYTRESLTLFFRKHRGKTEAKLFSFLVTMGL